MKKIQFSQLKIGDKFVCCNNNIYVKVNPIIMERKCNYLDIHEIVEFYPNAINLHTGEAVSFSTENMHVNIDVNFTFGSLTCGDHFEYDGNKCIKMKTCWSLKNRKELYNAFNVENNNFIFIQDKIIVTKT